MGWDETINTNIQRVQGSVMLTAKEIQGLREKIRTNQNRRAGRRVPVTFQGGPLDGLRVAVEAVATTGMYLGWCVTTPDGPVQVLYQSHGDGIWTFDCLDSGVR